MSVHYKFKSSKDTHTYKFDGLHITLGELKKAIMQQQKIGKSADLDLQITNAQTKEIYSNNSTPIPKNTSLIIARVPVANSSHKKWNKNNQPNNTHNNNVIIDTSKNQDNSNKATAGNATGSEEDKIKEILTLSTKDYDPSKYARGRGPMGPLPPNYTCYRCGKPGHYIKHCPTNNSEVKRSTGIPRSFMIPANPEQKGAMITANGEYAVPLIDHVAYKEVKKEKPPFFDEEKATDENQQQQQKIEIPDDLQCSLCKNLLQDAVLIPCCGNSFCDECIRLLLLESENHECPLCHETDVSPDTLIPNRFLRISVGKFKNETGYQNTTLKQQKKSENIAVTKEDSSAKLPEVGNDSAGNDLTESESGLEKPMKESNEGDAEIDLKERDQDKDVKVEDNEAEKEVDLDESIIMDRNLTRKKEATPEETQEDENKEKNSNEKNDPDKKCENPIETIGDGEPSSNNSSSSVNQLTVIQGLPPPPPHFNFGSNFAQNRFRNPIRVRSSTGGIQPPMFPRPPGPGMLPLPPRLTHNRAMMPDSSTPFFPDPMTGFNPMGLPHLPPPPPYGPYGPQIRNQMYDQMYGMNNRHGATLNPLLGQYPNQLNPMATLNGRNLPMMDPNNRYYQFAYKYRDDYEDKLERFNRQLESRSRRYRNENDRHHNDRSRSRSRTPRSRSRSVSSRSSHSSDRSASNRPSNSSRRSQSRPYRDDGRSRRSERSRSHTPSNRPSNSSSSHRSYNKSSMDYDHMSSRYKRSRSRSHSKYEKRGEYRERSRERSDREKRYYKSSSSSSKRPESYHSNSQYHRGDREELSSSSMRHNRDKYARQGNAYDEMVPVSGSSQKKIKMNEGADFDRSPRRSKSKSSKVEEDESQIKQQKQQNREEETETDTETSEKRNKEDCEEECTVDNINSNNNNNEQWNETFSDNIAVSFGRANSVSASATDDDDDDAGVVESINDNQVEELREEDQKVEKEDSNTTNVNTKNLSEDLSLSQPVQHKSKTKNAVTKTSRNSVKRKSEDDVEIKIQEDYSDLDESLEKKLKPKEERKSRKDRGAASSNSRKRKTSTQSKEDKDSMVVSLEPDNKMNQNEEENEKLTHSKIVKTNEDGKLLVSISIPSKRSSREDKDQTDSSRKSKSYKTKEIEQGDKLEKVSESKLRSKISLKDNESKDKEKDRKSSKHDRSEKKDSSDSKSKDKKDRSKDRHHHSSSSKNESKPSSSSKSSSSSSTSKDKKKDKEEKYKHRSSKKRSHRSKHRSSSSSEDEDDSPVPHKKIKSAIDPSYNNAGSSSSKRKSNSSKSYRK